MENVYVASAARTNFSEKWQTDRGVPIAEAERSIYTGISGMVDAVLESAPEGFDPLRIGAGHLAAIEPSAFTGQTHLAAILGTALRERISGFTTMPSTHHTNACASAGAAMFYARMAIQSGRTDAALVMGVEQMRTKRPVDVGRILACGMDRRTDDVEAPAHSFAELTRAYMKRYGFDDTAYDRAAGFVVNNDFTNARGNPNAQFRENSMTLELASAEHEADAENADEFRGKGNARFTAHDERFHPLKLRDFAQITDGAAAVLLISERYARELGMEEGVVVAGNSLQVDALSLTDKLVGGSLPAHFDGFHNAAKIAMEEAGLDLAAGDARKMSWMELYDCFPITQLMILEHLGFAEPGKAFNLDGSFWEEWGPKIDASGGLLADGHPIGATGARMVYELWNRLRDSEVGDMGMMTSVGDIFGSSQVAIFRNQKIE